MKSLLPVFVAATLSCSAGARAGSLVDVSIVDRDTGTTLSTYAHDGKIFIAGTPGHRYAVRIANHSGTRVLTVLSVDGVNAVTGETASPEESGYVLDAYQSTEVNGWRKSMNEIAQFNFTALSDSYAARTGRPDNVGVIGVAVFREKQQPMWHDDKIAARDNATDKRPTQLPATPATAQAAPPAAAAESAAAPAMAKDGSMASAGRAERLRQEESLGTGHGAREDSYVSYTNFERESSRPNEVVSMWYDSYHNLIARGVIPQPRPLRTDPQPFPGGFVPDPAS